MWEAFRQGRTLDLRTGIAAEDDPLHGPAWGADRTVRAQVVAELLLAGPPAAPGRVTALKLAGVRVGGRLMLSGATVTPYVQFDDCRFDEHLMLQECQAGSMRLVRCRIPRLDAARLQMSGDLHLPQCRIDGGIRLTDAHIGTDLLLNDVTVRPGRSSRAIAADGLTVGQDLDAELIDVTGELSLRSARIGGRLSLRGATLRNPGGRQALNAARIAVEHTLYLSGGRRTVPGAAPSAPPAPDTEIRDFTCHGGLRLDDGRFGNALVISRARFLTSTAEQQVSIRRIQTPELCWRLHRAPNCTVVVSGTVGKLNDSPRAWPGPGRVRITSFTYDTLTPLAEFPLAARLEWLQAATPEFRPEPYERLAAALRAAGEDAEAREVLLARQRRRRETLPLAGRVWGWVQDVTVGYGYRPGRAAIWMALLWALGAVYFALHPSPQPADAGGYRPHWSPPLYALDLLLPVIDLGQDNAWRETGIAQWVASVLTLLGWMLATTAAAGASRLLRRST
ncbi:oxidoreductase [Streptomyces sp. NRRL F-5123]|uniref:oxidoreductase n=1 Tax=Streptomyces sp. NRRL F-5123 TaxID=1463856 RepID=UPI0018FF3A86|nr:oxidoreductase [Streptomyces sp. NRRL F-5123]